MRGLTDFDSGELVTIDGRDLKFEGLVPPEKQRLDDADDLQFLDARNRRAVNFTPEEFLSLYANGLVHYHRARRAPGDTVGDDEAASKAIMRGWRHYWVTTFDKAPVPKSTSKLAGFIAENEGGQPTAVDPPSPHTLRRWLREREEEGRRMPRQMGDRARPRFTRKPVHAFVQNTFGNASQRYWSNYRTTFEDVQIEVRAAVMRENDRRMTDGLEAIDVPGRTTLWRWLHQERTYENVLTREGRHVANRMFQAIKGSLSAKRIMDVAVIDHKRMDVHLVDASRRFVIGRPWLAAMIDVKSRMIVGISLSFEDPSVLSLMACVRSALRGQPDMKQRFSSIDGEWEAFGSPRTILADNAWENTGSSFIDACADCAISIEWAPIKTPEHKGIVERFFSRLDDQFAHKLPGAVVDNPFALAARRIDPRVDACLTLPELEELLYRFIVDVYACDLHAGINAIPLKVWREAAARDGIELAHDLADVEHAMGALVRDRTLNHEGVTFNGLVYRSAAIEGVLADLIPHQAASVRSGSARVKIKYHPEDLSRIFVWNEVRNRYVALPCTDQDYARGLSERVHMKLRALARDDNDAFVSEKERCQKKDSFLNEIQNSFEKLPQKDRRRRARMLGGSNAKTALERQVATISVDGMGSRVGGNRPEKSAVRSRKTKRASPANPSNDVPEEFEISDPFAGRDRQMAIERSSERLA